MDLLTIYFSANRTQFQHVIIAWDVQLTDWLAGVQGRKLAEVAGMAQRVDRLADQAGGGSMVTTKSLASFDGEEDEGEVLQRLNVILKVSDMRMCLSVVAIGSVRPEGLSYCMEAAISQFFCISHPLYVMMTCCLAVSTSDVGSSAVTPNV